MKSSISYLPNIYFVLLVLLSGDKIYGEKILFVLPLASKSHVNIFEPFVRALGERGHEIVNLSPIESPDMPPNVRQIQLLSDEEFTNAMPSNLLAQRSMSIFGQMFNNTAVFDNMEKACEKAIKDVRLQEIIKKEQFDLVIIDVLLHYWLLGVIPILKAPSIYVSTFPPPSILPNVVGNRVPPSIVPSPPSGYTETMSFKERFVNFLLDAVMSGFFSFVMIPRQEQIYRRNLAGGKDLPSLSEIQKNVSMIFMNTHFTLKGPRPLLPDVIEIGGIHTRPSKPLEDKKMVEFLNGSGEDGFILFSLGSIVKSNHMPEETRKVFVNVFKRLKQRVLWKWDGENMTDLPKNVLLSKWVPQQDILGHPKIKLFMTHGGLLSIQESVYHGVPFVGLPVFGDQDLNVLQAEKGGFGKFLEIVDLTEVKLKSTLMELLNNPKYSRRVKELSRLVKDLPMTPLETAVYWTEYVLRHKGAVHLRSTARDLNFFQYYILDVIAVLVIILAAILLITFKCCQYSCRKVFCRNTKNEQNKAKKE